MLEMQLSNVRDFHMQVTGQPMADVPTMLVADRRDYAIKFLDEELTEFKDACTIADQADALIDMIYVAYGRLLEMGIQPGPSFQLVHEANLKKVRGPTKRGGVYDAAKPDGWQPPDWEDHLSLDKGQYIGLTREVDQFGGPRPRTNPWDNSCQPFFKSTVEREDYEREHRKPKILLLGYGRHGKDTVAEILESKYGLTFTSSSMVCAEKVMMPVFNRHDGVRQTVIYADVKECFNDRHNHRVTWFKAIEEFNTPDKSALGRIIFEANDIYVGLRSAREFHAVRNAGLYDVCIWVDRSQHVPPEDRSSCTVEPWMADYVIDNNGTLDELAFNVDALMWGLEKKRNA